MPLGAARRLFQSDTIPNVAKLFMNRRHPDFRMPPLVLAGLFFVQLASMKLQHVSL